MTCKTAFCLIVLVLIVGCMGQTFQYSRGWTNGKRANMPHHEDSLILPVSGENVEMALERCLTTLQQTIRNPHVLHVATAVETGGKPRPGLTENPA